MDKKAKKKRDIINKKVQQLQRRLSGAKEQDDEPGEVERLEKEIADLRAEAAELKKS
jgi:uncharacterized coiled-coil DUF342 family protein